jgi:hypothetical protein
MEQSISFSQDFVAFFRPYAADIGYLFAVQERFDFLFIISIILDNSARINFIFVRRAISIASLAPLS